MRIRSATGAAAIAACLALAVSGCGGPSAEVRFRKEQLHPVQQQIDKEKSVLSADLNVVHVKKRADARMLRAQIDRLAAAMARLDTLKPPDSVADDLARYRSANTKLIVSLKKFTTALLHGSGLTTASNEARDAAGAVQRARNALDEAVAK